MAINPTKLLPPSKGALAVRGKGSDSVAKSKKGQTLEGQVLIIRTQVIKIEKLISRGYTLKLKEQKEEEKEKQKEKRGKREQELEEKKPPKEGKGKLPTLPKLGFLDRIKNFIGNMLLAFFAVKLIDHLPKLVPFVTALGNATEFLLDVGGKLLDGLVTFIDWGYKAYDATKGFLKNLGGENFAKVFDGFSGAIGNLVDVAIIAAIALGSGGGDDRGGVPSRGKPRVTTSGGKPAGRPDVRNPFRQRPTVTTGQGGKPAGPKIKVPRGVKARGGLLGLVFLIPDLIDSGMLVSQGRGKDGLRTLLSAVSGVVAGMAAYSATLAGAAALGITGVGLPAAIGLALAGFAASSAAGAAAYNLADAGLRKMGLVDKDSSGKPYAYKSGGPTRGGKRRGAIRRTGGISGKKKIRRKLSIAQKPREIEFENPGADAGGKEKVQGFFGFLKDSVDKVNPFNTVKETGKDLGKTDYFGPILAITSKITLGQKPTSQDYKQVGLGINLLLSKGIQDGKLLGGVATFAEGGFVDPKTLEAISSGGDISDWVASTFKGAIETNAQRTLRMIRENADKKKQQQGQQAPSAGDMGMGAGVQVSSDSEDFWLLATAAMFENSHPQGAADVAQVIYNRTQYPAWNAPTIRKAILNPGQFQPVRQYGGAGAWGSIKNKQDALRFSKTYGKTQEQLERVAAALLDKSKQNDARAFVGPRDSFRADAYERANNHLADDTEKSRHGHTFGFEPGGAMIGQFKAGKLAAAQVNANVTGNVNLKPGDGRFIQGNSGRSGGTHFHIGTNKPGDGSGVASAGFNVIKNFLGKKSVYVGRSGETIPANATDEQIRGYIGRGQAAHRQTELDLQIGGLGAGNKVAFPLALKNMKYSDTDGYGVSADIVGTNAFVGHGRYKPDGSLAPQQKLVLNMGAPDYYAFHGKSFGIVPKNGLTLRLHPGEMFKVIDKDSVDLLGYDLTKDIIDIENKAQLAAKAPSIIERLKAISGYASYEDGAQEEVIVMQNQESDDQSTYQNPMVISGGGSGGDSYDPFAGLDSLPG